MADIENEAGPSQSPVKRVRSEKRKRKSSNHGARVEEWECVPIAESVVSRVPCVWSRDGRFYFQAGGNSIHIHSAESPHFTLLSTLSGSRRKGRRADITGLILHPTNPSQLLTSTDVGQVKIWDWVEGRLVRTLNVAEGGGVSHLCAGEVGKKWYIFVTAAQRKEGKPKQKDGFHLRHRVLRIPLAPPRPNTETEPIKLVGKISAPPSALFISPQNTYLVALSANKAYTYLLPSSAEDPHWRATCVKFVSDQIFTCGAFCPESPLSGSSVEWFATGDVKGVIRLWHGLQPAFKQLGVRTSSNANGPLSDPGKPNHSDIEKRLPTTSLHWHAHAVSALAFTPSGAQLLSVGEESVLVQWHLASGKREYIPRLGGRSIISLAVKSGARGSEEEWWAGMADGGTARIGAASGNVSTVGQIIRLDPLKPKNNGTYYPLAVHPPTGSVVIPSSHPSTLQFIDLSASTVKLEIEVSPSNRVSKRDEKELEAVAVEHVAFTDNTVGPGRWMATVEGREGDEVEGGGAVRTLKMWKWVGEKYVINTQYPRPHDGHDIVAIAFSPSRQTSTTFSDPYLVTASANGMVKMWQVRQSKRPGQGKGNKSGSTFEYYWSCRSTFSYRSMPVYAASFSPDATLLALAHGNVVTIWDVESNVMIKTLESAFELHQLGFVGGEGRWLVAAGRRQGLIAWDLLSCQAPWSLSDQPSSRLITIASHDIFYVMSDAESKGRKTLFTGFSPISSTQLHRRTVPTGIRHVLPLASTGTTDIPSFIGVTTSGEVVRFGDGESEIVSKGAGKIDQKAMKGVSIWQEMFGKDAFVDVSVELAAPEPQVRSATKRGRPEEVWGGPSHTLPPSALLFDSFMERLLQPQIQGSKELNTSREDGIVFEEVEAEDDMIIPARQPPARTIPDEEVKDLESYFVDLLELGASKSKTAKAMPNGNGHPPNGHVGSSDIDSDANGGETTPYQTPTSETTKSYSKSKRTASKAFANGVDIDSELDLHAPSPKRQGRASKR